MDNKIKICLVGKMRSGKSSVVEYLVNEYFKNKKIEVVDFGDALKEITYILYPQSKKAKDRNRLQLIGQHLRKIDEDIWVNVVARKIKKSTAEVIICASCRQNNEYEYLKKEGFVFIKIDCSDELRIQRAKSNGDNFDLSNLNHETEVSIDSFNYDYNIINNKGVNELHKNINRIMGDILHE